MKSIVSHPVCGEITVCRNRRAKRISLTVRHPGRVRLTLPTYTPLSEGMRFVARKEDWIRKNVEKYTTGEPLCITTPYYTREHTLVLIPTPDIGSPKFSVSGGEIRVRYPSGTEVSDTGLQLVIRRAIEEAWRIEAKNILPEKVAYFAGKFGLKYRSVSVRNTVSKWGSCSGLDDISLSLHLMRLPEHLIDYIVIHELCHTVHKNHGPHFHALLDELTGGRHREMQKEIKEYQPRW